MDASNRFHSRASYLLVRWDFLFLGAFISVLLLTHVAAINWWRFAVAFWWIDVLGYIPGAIYYRTVLGNGAKPMPSIFVVIYNVCHNVGVNLAALIAWHFAIGHYEWAMLAAPLHLCIDRGLFGNIYKTRVLSFEPIEHPDFAVFLGALAQRGRWLGRDVMQPRDRGGPLGRASIEQLAPQRRLVDLVRRHADHPSIGLVFNRDTQHFMIDGLDAFIAYRRRGKTMFCFGGPVGTSEDRRALLAAFVSHAENERCRVIALQVLGQDVQLFADRGFRINQMGCSYTLDISDFTLAGNRFMKLRNKIKQPGKAGVEVRELSAADCRTPATRRAIDDVTAVWLKGKGPHIKELSFLVGEVESIEREGTRCFAAFRDDEMLAFITYVPSFGRFEGFMHDLTRRKPTAPAGTLEAINCRAIEAFRKDGVRYLNFGFTPLIGIEDTHPTYSPGMAKLFRVMADKAAFVYPAFAQAAYKRKWCPQHVEPEYVTFQGSFTLAQLWSFLRLTRSI